MQYQDSLKERIKELECLYAISTLTSKSSAIAPILPSICEILEQAFQFPNLACAKISISHSAYGNNTYAKRGNEIKQNIVFQKEIIGQICVGYEKSDEQTLTFLLEEKKLLNKVAQELSFLYEREERSKNEDRLNEIVRRQERLTVLGEMTAGIAHELNTPLGNIIGFSEFILTNSKENSTLKDAKKINQSALHAREIVKKLMLFSCDIPQKLKSTNVRRIIEESINLLAPLLKQNNIHPIFKNECKKDRALIDEVQFTQVLFNLLNNAIQASEPQGVIKITLTEKKGFISIKIEDFGVGIPNEIQDKIFDPFFTFNKKGTGNGLGLSVVHGIIKQHKGRIQFSSEINKGTTFVISIPQQP